MSHGAPQHQPARRNFRPVLAVVGAVLALLLVLHWMVQALFDVAIPEPDAPAQMGSASAAALDIDALHEAKRSRLQRYGWVDRERGIAHIPIEEAMQLVLKRQQQSEDARAQESEQ